MSTDVHRVIAELAGAGLDLVHAFDAHAIGERAREAAALEANDDANQTPGVFSKTIRPLARWTQLADGPRLGLLVGNTRELWPHFVAARASLPSPNPLDAYVERAIESALASCSSEPHDAGAVFSHRTYDGVFLPFQALAVATGLAAPTDAGLVVHPIYGPWFALRALITLDVPADFAIPTSVRLDKPCACADACEAARELAFANPNDWRSWLGVRDACSLRAWRYSDEQIRFHYASAWPDAGRE